jgi:hypothetical protein
MEMSDAVMEMLAERLAGRPPILPPPTRREEAPEPVRMRTWSAFIQPKHGEPVLETLNATCIEDARTKAQALGKLLYRSLPFNFSVRRAPTSPRFESAFGEL